MEISYRVKKYNEKRGDETPVLKWLCEESLRPGRVYYMYMIMKVRMEPINNM